MASTTLVTFLVQTPKSTTSVKLLGSWDNFSRPYSMKRDERMGHGHWRGCHSFTDIICDGDTVQTPANSRSGGLKMGGRYWYYYQVDDDIEYHSPSEPSTTSCPLLPGQEVNVLDVPVQLRDTVSANRRSSVSSTCSVGYTLNPEDKYLEPRLQASISQPAPPKGRSQPSATDLAVGPAGPQPPAPVLSGPRLKHLTCTSERPTTSNGRATQNGGLFEHTGSNPFFFARQTPILEASHSRPCSMSVPYWTDVGVPRSSQSEGQRSMVADGGEFIDGINRPEVESNAYDSRHSREGGTAVYAWAMADGPMNDGPMNDLPDHPTLAGTLDAACPVSSEATCLQDDREADLMRESSWPTASQPCLDEGTKPRTSGNMEPAFNAGQDWCTRMGSLSLESGRAPLPRRDLNLRSWINLGSTNASSFASSFANLDVADQAKAAGDFRTQAIPHDPSLEPVDSDMQDLTTPAGRALSTCASDIFPSVLSIYTGTMSSHLSQPLTPSFSDFGGFVFDNVNSCDDKALYGLPSVENTSALTLRDLPSAAPGSSRGDQSPFEQKSGMERITEWNDGAEDRKSGLQELVEEMGYLGTLIV